MPKTPRTFKLGKKLMKGSDVTEWQKTVKSLFRQIGIDAPIKVDGTYGQATRGFTASLLEAYGLVSSKEMADGVTPELRTKLRNKQFTKAEKTRFESKARTNYRAELRDRWRKRKVHPPINRIVTDAWGFVPGVHDGIDVTAPFEGAAAFAMVKSRVVDVRASGWARPPSGPQGNGIVQLEVLESVGPFKKGQHIGYGHVEHARVKVGQTVQAGAVVALVGMAVTPHIHLMVNNGRTDKGVGTINPRAHLDYAVKHG